MCCIISWPGVFSTVRLSGEQQRLQEVAVRNILRKTH